MDIRLLSGENYRRSRDEISGENMDQIERTVEKIKKNTGFDEYVIGCSLTNYNNQQVCGRFRNSGCGQLVMCQLIRRIEGRFVSEEVLK